MAYSPLYPHFAPASSSQSSNCDVFLSFRGEDTRKTFVDHLYPALADRKIPTYKDDETLPRGDSIRLSLFKAIKGSHIALIIFSKNYANSSWCLEELACIMECKDKSGLIVMPIFYDVDPSEVRNQNGIFGEAFDKHKVENIVKVESWRNALVDASEIAGWELKNIANGHEAKGIKQIVDMVSKKLVFLTSSVDENLVGMRARLQELEEQLKIRSNGVRMVGIWGGGGSGKTTLASSLYMKISCHFQGHCIVESVREKSNKYGLESLQEKIISSLLNMKIELSSVEEGRHIISRLSRSNVLLILDDVDDCKQLDALAGSHNWFGNGSRIIITSRDEHVLITHKVDHVCPVTLLSRDEAIALFNKHAYNKNNLVNDYEKLSLQVVSYADGLPLALKVLGSFLHGKDEKEWMSSLARLKDIPQLEIVEKLKISYDGLNNVEKELFLDIVCFFRGKSVKNTYYGTDDAIEVFEACGYHPSIGIKVLKQKSLITILDGRFDMHDLIQEMGHYIVRGEYPNNPEKHSRVWKDEEIRNLFLGDATKENHKIEAIQYLHHDAPEGHLSLFCKIVSSMKKLRWLSLTLYNNHDENAEGPTFLSNELRYINWHNYPRSPLPNSFQPTMLASLKLSRSFQKQIWKGYKHLPHLKVLLLRHMKNLQSTPDFVGLPCLQKLTLHDCKELQEIHPSLGKHTSLEYVSVSDCRKLRIFPTIIQMEKLKTLEIRYCHKSLEFPEIISNMENLVKLYLANMGIDNLFLYIGDQCPNLISLDLVDCFYLNNKEVNFYGLKHLEQFKLHGLNHLEMQDHMCISWLTGKVACGRQILHRLQFSNTWLGSVFPQLTQSLRKLDLDGCRLKDGEVPSNIGELSNLQELNLSRNNFTRLDFTLLQLKQLKILTLTNCKWLVELPKLPSGIFILTADFCKSLTMIGDFYANCKWLCQVSLVRGGVIIDGREFLKFMCTMLEGNVVINHSMLLKLEGIEIAKGFRTPLVRGSRCRLQLPENWSNDFSGFLMCAAGTYEISYYSQRMSIEHVLSGMDYEDDVVWEKTDNDKRTLVWYVSFASLRQTTWWNSTYKAVMFSLGLGADIQSFTGFGVALVARRGGSGLIETSITQQEYEFSCYTPNFNIVQDLQYALKIEFPSKYEAGNE